MINGGYCEYTCGKCKCTTPKDTILALKTLTNCDCGNIVPKSEGNQLSCAKQVSTEELFVAEGMLSIVN